MFPLLSTETRQTIAALYGLNDVSVAFQRPMDDAHGDLSTAVALQIAKGLEKSPREIAERIADALRLSPSVQKAEVAGAGYVNVWLTPATLLAELAFIQRSLRPAPIRAGDDPVIIDYSQPNIAKPLGIHHILSTVIGQTLCNLYRYAGCPVIGWNYIGDWGTQFGKLAVAFEQWGGKPVRDCSLDELLALYVRFHQEAEQDPSLEEKGREAFRRMEQGDEELRAFWRDVVDVTKASLGAIYERLQVSFDVDTGESFYEDKMPPILEEGKEKGVFRAGEKGALIAEFPEKETMPPAIVLKGDGATIYLTRDLAMMKDRIERFHPQSVLFVVDVAQSLHFRQLFAIARQLEWSVPVLEHVSIGRMRFADKSMSTRKGNILKLEHVLDEAVDRARAIIRERGEAIQTDDPEDLAEMMGVGALVYGILSQNRKMDMVFDWEKMLSFEGNSAPYLQYTYARARSVLRKAGMEEGANLPADAPALTDHERILIRTLLLFPAALEEARADHLPHKLATYLHRLAQDFNAFYNADAILQAPEPLRDLRLALTSYAADVLRCGCALLTLRVPERM